MAATRRVDSAASRTVEQPSSTPQAPVVTALVQQALSPKQRLPQVLNAIPIKLKHANDLLSAKNHSAAANAYRELYYLLTDTTHIQGLLYRSFCLQSLAYCTFRLQDKVNTSLIISALADLQEALLKLESFSDADKQIQYYRAIKTHYEALTTWDNQCEKSLYFIQKSHEAKSLPTLDELLDDDWLEGLRLTASFQEFLSHLHQG